MCKSLIGLYEELEKDSKFKIIVLALGIVSIILVGLGIFGMLQYTDYTIFTVFAVLGISGIVNCTAYLLVYFIAFCAYLTKGSINTQTNTNTKTNTRTIKYNDISTKSPLSHRPVLV